MSKEAIEYIKSKHKCYVPHLFTPNDCAELMQAYADEVNKHYTKGVEEFALKVVYSKQKDGRHFLEIFAEDGKRKFQEWCKYKDGSFNYR